MHFGVSMFPTRYSVGPAELARAVEERGFESLFFPEHTHIPTSRRSPWPGGADLPGEYRETLDPFLALTAAAAVTERILLGTGICLVVERDPITTAKEVATLDLLSGGRFLFGIGGGWNREEMENHGTDPTRRFAVMRERVLAMKEIWTKDEAEFHGEYVDFDPLWQWPKPVQRPHPPVLVAGNGPKTLDRVLEYGDGWIPIPGRGSVPLGEGTVRLREMAAERGREAPPVTVFGARPQAEVLEHYAAAGVDRVLFALPPVEAAEAFKFLDSYANLVETERS
ncbi:MAG TPA: LLM class F420-dependent oxidoreductase [Acidimicrobiia bacterium]|nr:LLM class F420-dependent oxidoreductase [Acidimicrobiia bacterium]